jgi:hypothetical protein
MRVEPSAGRYYKIWVCKDGLYAYAGFDVYAQSSAEARDSANKDLRASGKYKGLNLPRTKAM